MSWRKRLASRHLVGHDVTTCSQQDRERFVNAWPLIAVPLGLVACRELLSSSVDYWRLCDQ